MLTGLYLGPIVRGRGREKLYRLEEKEEQQKEEEEEEEEEDKEEEEQDELYRLWMPVVKRKGKKGSDERVKRQVPHWLVGGQKGVTMTHDVLIWGSMRKYVGVV